MEVVEVGGEVRMGAVRVVEDGVVVVVIVGRGCVEDGVVSESRLEVEKRVVVVSRVTSTSSFCVTGFLGEILFSVVDDTTVGVVVVSDDVSRERVVVEVEDTASDRALVGVDWEKKAMRELKVFAMKLSQTLHGQSLSWQSLITLLLNSEVVNREESDIFWSGTSASSCSGWVRYFSTS
jgi:hypothetical protein